MASWLKAAEDLFEVVDRRAKLVVSELSDEQQDGQAPASNGQGSQAKKTKSKPKSKAQKRLLTNKPSKTNDTTQVQTDQQPAVLDIAPDKDRATRSFESDGTPSSNSTVPENNELLQNGNKDASMFGTPSSETLPGGTVKMKVDLPEVVPTVSDVEAVASTSNGELVNDKVDINEGQPTSVSPGAEVEIVSEDYSVDAGQNLKSRDADVTSQIDQDGSQSASVDAPSVSETQSNDTDSKVETSSNQKKQQEHKGDASPTKLLEVETSSNQKKQQEHKDDASPMKLQDQLDEAQGLLKTAVSTGQSKEARLTRVCAGLLTRLQECKSENAQLEELLAAEKELSNSYEARIKQLHQDLSASKIEVSKVESSMVEALAAKNSEIEALVNSMDALKKQAVFSEGNMASMQANMESIMRNRELTETRMMQALREELASAERRAEEERAAHHATKMAAMEREVELEHRAVEASTALARIQRVADERTAKAAEFEQKVALLEVECASLNQELQDMEARARRGQKKSPEEANQVIQAWQEEGERARLGQRDAEAKLSSMEAEVQKMRVEMAAMKRDAEHYSRQEHMELEKRYRELTDLLYYKQTQLEAMASEKSAAEFQLEKEVKRLKEAQVEAERSRTSRRGLASWEDDTDIKALEPLPLHHRHMAAAGIQLQKAAKLIDSGVVRATKFLWRYPTARVLLVFYLVFVHLFLMYLLHHLQEQADELASREVAQSMGLANPTLP